MKIAVTIHLILRMCTGLINFLYIILLWIWPLFHRKRPSRILPPKDPLLMLSATTIARMIRQREITSYQVVYLYTERIKEVNCVVNAVVDNRYGPAIIEAKICDEQYAAGKFNAETLEKEKPLYGVPVTIKECFAVKGLSHSGCSLSRKGIKATADSTVVELLRNAGAIPLCVTNTPEMCSNINSTNILYGKTLNPYDTRYSAGGSSSGEGALLGAGASLIGVGSDLAGSVRIPALFNGVFGHKPTSKTIEMKGHFPMVNNPFFLSYLICGPMTRYAEDLYLLMRVLTSTCSHDLHLTEPVDLNQLKIYYLQNVDQSFGLLSVTSDMKQCILKTTNYFKKRGLSIEKLPIDWPVTIFESGLVGLLQIGEPTEIFYPDETRDRKYIYLELLKSLFGKSRYSTSTTLFSSCMSTRFPFTKSDELYYTQDTKKLQQSLQDLLGNNGVFIYPTFRCASIFLEVMTFEFVNNIYTGIFNILGFPATHVPLGFNDKGLPIGIQVIAAPYQDRLCLAVAKELETAFGGWTPPPYSTVQSKYDESTKE